MALVTARHADQEELSLTGIGFDFVGEFAVYADLDCTLELTSEEFGRG